MKYRQIGKKYCREGLESDIIEFNWLDEGLRIEICTWKNKNEKINIEYLFESFHGFRYLEEGDLINYWDGKNFNDGFHLYEIEEGGWISGERIEESMLVVSKYSGFKEYFICTSNWSATVIAIEDPVVKESQ